LPDIAAVRASLRHFGRVISIPEILTNSPPARFSPNHRHSGTRAFARTRNPETCDGAGFRVRAQGGASRNDVDHRKAKLLFN
jgi:hypothetical protein